MHFIAHINASTSEWRYERHARTFLAPNKPSKPGKVLNHLCLENMSLSFQDQSIKHHLPEFVWMRLICTSCATRWFLKICVSAQSVDSNSAILRVSLGSISILLNILLFRPFQIYHNIHAYWWSSIFGLTLQKRWSILAKKEPIGKIFGFNGILDRAHTCRAGRHSKNIWLIDSSWSPHRVQHVSPCIPLAFRFFMTAIQPESNCHKKCFIFRGHLSFQQ